MNTILRSNPVRATFSKKSLPYSARPLTLEFNEIPANGSQHWFRNLRWDDDYDSYDLDSPIYEPQEVMDGSWHDPAHGWENGVQVEPPPFLAQLPRLTEYIFEP
ncbi:unnamed protein product [Fusarium venenatum]|uniref:Uncharacterized protein n=1 Tax=Fusarium venenatum TaxID=56646 RepID=A0A2L2T8J3_9HYPO|nr:uncharacterized protein FVRRES_02611 [Fusarium venenatum]CEI66099.1 unnamed protein product [Fusarium venenatum]